MGLFAAMMTYLVAAALLVGSMVTGVALFFSQPAEPEVAKAPPPLVRAADRKGEKQAEKQAEKQPPAAPRAIPGPVINHKTVEPPRPGNAEHAREHVKEPAKESAREGARQNERVKERAKERTASRPVRKKTVTKPAPAPEPELDPDTATLGYGPPEPRRKFIFPLDPGW